MPTSESRPKRYRRSRDKYSRLICLGCRERRIRCELPADIEIPNPGELLTVQTPCYRCKKLAVPCVVRQTVLGRPGSERLTRLVVEDAPAVTGDVVSPAVIGIWPATSRCSQRDSAPAEAVALSQPHSLQIALDPAKHPCPSEDNSCRSGGSLLIHKPQSPETVAMIRAMETLRMEHVEHEWFRHLPSHFGHTRALDLSIKALVAASAYKWGQHNVTAGDCYQSLAFALGAVQRAIRESSGPPDDDVLASTALLAHFEGRTKKHGIPTRLHIHGLAAILTARTTRYPVSQLARDILDFHACEAFIQACIRGVPSSIEGVGRAYFERSGAEQSDRARLQSLSAELFIRVPRLASFVHSLRHGSPPQSRLLSHARNLSRSLLQLQDSRAEGCLLKTVDNRSPDESSPGWPLTHSLHFASIELYEALAFYWQGRLSLLRLSQALEYLVVGECSDMDKQGMQRRPDFQHMAEEMSRLVQNILMCSEYAQTFVLNKHFGRFSQAMMSVWGVLKDEKTIASFAKGEGQMDCVKDAVLRMANRALRVTPEFTAEDMDVAADVFVGGQSEGRFAAMYDI